MFKKNLLPEKWVYGKAEQGELFFNRCEMPGTLLRRGTCGSFFFRKSPFSAAG